MINILNRYENRWDKLATDQAPIFLGDHAKEMADEVTRLFKAFDNEVILYCNCNDYCMDTLNIQ